MSLVVCNHTSVGLLVFRHKELLLIERMKFPFGYAPPAGHVDEDETYEDAGKRELNEEVGLIATKLEYILEAKMDYPCRRENGTWHLWKVYNVETSGDLKPSHEETKRAVWTDNKLLQALAMKTKNYIDGKITDQEWAKDPGIELVWYDLLKKLKFIE